MYLLSLRLAPSPWVGTSVSATAQYTVPSVSTHTVTPRRVLRLQLGAPTRRAGRPFGLVHDNVAPRMGLCDIAPGREPDHLQPRNLRRARRTRDRLEVRCKVR